VSGTGKWLWNVSEGDLALLGVAFIVVTLLVMAFAPAGVAWAWDRRREVARALGYFWSLPYGLVGLLAAGVVWALGWVEFGTWRAGALEVVCRGRFANRMIARGWGAVTIGWTIVYWSEPTGTLRMHEHRHVDQALVLGPLFPLVYLVLLVVGYRRNPLERDARRAAGEPD
jgi:hypothetical protein